MESRATLDDGTALSVTYNQNDKRGGRGRDWWLPAKFTIDARGGRLGSYKTRLDVQVRDGVPTCARVTVEAADSRGVTLAGLRRVTVDNLVSEALSLVVTQTLPPAAGDEPGMTRLWPWPEAGVVADATRNARRAPVTPEVLREAADAYRWARAHEPRRATQAAAERLNVSRSTFDRLRRRALNEGYLRPDETATTKESR